MSGPVRNFKSSIVRRDKLCKFGRTTVRSFTGSIEHQHQQPSLSNIDTFSDPASARRSNASTEVFDDVASKTDRRVKVSRFYSEKQSRPAPNNVMQDIQVGEPPNRQRMSLRSPQADSGAQSKYRSRSVSSPVRLKIDGRSEDFSPLLLRDCCECQSCVDPSTKQKLFSTAEIPAHINARAAVQTDMGASILWNSDVAGYGREHTTQLGMDVLRSLVEGARGPQDVRTWSPEPQVAWDAKRYSQLPDVDYEAYMQDGVALSKALRQLHTHGLLFLRNVPESEKSVSTIAERIGPVKNTFYGYTWDVRSVPQAKNVAYTSQDLGFHMDLLYTHQPPHLQFLHCIRSSSAGGASLFTDSYKAAEDIFKSDLDSFTALSNAEVNFHYNHPSSHLYHQARRVFELKPLQWEGLSFNSIQHFKHWHETGAQISPGMAKYQGVSPRKPINILDHLSAVSWSPPFQAPFSLRSTTATTGTTGARASSSQDTKTPLRYMNRKIEGWIDAARKFNTLIHRPEGIYERLMRPGECVLFDNRRVLHARKAFEVGDMGKERWLRGAYLDKDPYESRMRVLSRVAANDGDAGQTMKVEAQASQAYFEESARA